MQFLKVNVNIGGIGAESFRLCIINLGHVKKITASDDKAHPGAKVTYIDGTTERLKETYEKVAADIMGDLEKHYRAPEPLDANAGS